MSSSRKNPSIDNKFGTLLSMIGDAEPFKPKVDGVESQGLDVLLKRHVSLMMGALDRGDLKDCSPELEAMRDYGVFGSTKYALSERGLPGLLHRDLMRCSRVDKLAQLIGTALDFGIYVHLSFDLSLNEHCYGFAGNGSDPVRIDVDTSDLIIRRFEAKGRSIHISVNRSALYRSASKYYAGCENPRAEFDPARTLIEHEMATENYRRTYDFPGFISLLRCNLILDDLIGLWMVAHQNRNEVIDSTAVRNDLSQIQFDVDNGYCKRVDAVLSFYRFGRVRFDNLSTVKMPLKRNLVSRFFGAHPRSVGVSIEPFADAVPFECNL